MAIKLPKYEKQVGTASGAGAMQAIDPSVATAPIRAATEAIGATTDMALDFGARLKKHKDEGDALEAENKYKVWEATLEQKKKEARLAGVKDEDIMDKVVVPAMEDFQRGIEEAGYSKKVRDLVDRNWSTRVQMIEAKEQGEVIENAITRANINKMDYGTSLLLSGDKEGFDRIVDELSATMPPEQLENYRSGSQYSVYNEDILNAERARAEGLLAEDPEAEANYFKELERIRTEADASDMNSRHKRTIVSTAMAKGNNYMSGRVKQSQKVVKDVKKLLADSEATAGDFEELEKTGPKGMSEALQKTIYSEMKGVAPTNKDAQKALEILVARSNGKISYEKAFKGMEKLGQHGQAGIWYLSEVMTDDVMNNGELPAFQGLFGAQEKYAVDGTTKDYITNMSSFIPYSDNPSSFFKSKINGYIDWRKRSPKATQEEYEIWRNEQFKTEINGFVGSFSAPQDVSKKAPQQAIDYLMANPEVKDQFEAKYGYLPEGI
jgi:hypothetical protein